MEGDAGSMNECPTEPQREGEHAITVPKTIKPEDLIPIKKYGLSEQWWDETKREMCEKYGELMASDLKIPRIVLTHEIFSYDFLNRGQKECLELAENKLLPTSERLAALDSLGYLADIATKKSKQILELGEKSNKKALEPKKRNLPPSTLVQVQVNQPPRPPVREAVTDIPD